MRLCQRIQSADEHKKTRKKADEGKTKPLKSAKPEGQKMLPFSFANPPFQ